MPGDGTSGAVKEPICHAESPMKLVVAVIKPF
jgi:hypothetical protein